MIHKATPADLDLVTHIEATCFPLAEAAPREAFKERLDRYAGQFLIAFDGDTPIGFIDGFVTDDEVLTDEMFADASLHNSNGAWQMIFGLNTMPKYRNRGVGGQLIEAFIELAREENRKGVILTCKEEKIPYYAKFGFVNEGASTSDHGGAKWYQMRLEL
ncbi:GNAT family N-acetyltransferase [Veillonella parvula]|nr:GNAT family N-acetyltransferase [Veillonella parvula]